MISLHSLEKILASNTLGRGNESRILLKQEIQKVLINWKIQELGMVIHH